jgi:hypothetical protein
MRTVAQKMTIVLVLFVSLAHTGCNRQDPEKLSAVGRKIGDKVSAVMNKSNDRLTMRWENGSADQLPPLDVRVHERLRWDRDLDGADIQVTSRGSLVELHGSVASADQRQHAVDLARATQGVDKVLEFLVVATAQN